MLGNTHIKNFIFLLCVFFITPSFALAFESISLYEVKIDINEDSSIKVLETITYDFGDNSKRGIYRNIPVKYESPYGSRSVQFELISVSRDGYAEEYTNKKSGKERVIKIGDPEVYIEGEHVYRITYEIKGAFNAFSKYDELYWNAIGTGWEVPIKKASVIVDTPSAIVQASCYEGFFGSNIPCSESLVSADVFAAKSTELSAGSGITVAVGLPKGAVALPGIWEILWNLLKNNAILLLPILAFIFMYREWELKGKDHSGRGTIIPQYEPLPSISPLMVGPILNDGKFSLSDLTASIIYLAEQGYLKIKREEKRFLGSKIDYIFTWVGNYDELNNKEQMVAEILFGINVHLNQTAQLSEIVKDPSSITARGRLIDYLDKDVSLQGYFTSPPQKSTNKWVVIGVIILILTMFGLIINVVTAISIGLSGLVILVFAQLMPKLTKKGAMAREHVLGFKEFLSVTEKDRLAFHNAPMKTTEEFMEYLPYAIALGVEKKWANQFESLDIESPEWYEDGSSRNFTSAGFAGAMSSLETSVQAGVSAASGGSGSGGGGFSGGGGGGGGGGSW